MRALLELVAATVCVACGAHADGELCGACARRVVVVGGVICERCGAPTGPQHERQPCPCAELAGFGRARSLVAFAEPARALTLSVKRRGRRTTATAMGKLLAALAEAHGLHADTVTFVPGSRAARRRGFDHAELLARSVARGLGSRFAALLTRTGDGPRQSDVSLAQRRMNVRERFAAGPAHGTILVVDDVFTTGATAEACAVALTSAGATVVDVVTWARTLKRLV